MQASTLSSYHKSWNRVYFGGDISTYKRTRKLVHQAVQLVAAVSRSLLPSEVGDVQSDLFWMPDRNMLAGMPIGFNTPHQIAFDILNFQLVSLDRQGYIIQHFKLVGKSSSEALSWLNEQVASDVSISMEIPYELPFVSMPPSKAYEAPDSTSLQYICKWFSNASMVLGPLSLKLPDNTVPICKPDSLDMKSLSTILETGDETQTIELGMSLGDSDYPMPYFYTIPHPSPKAEDLPYYKHIGKWHTFPWVGIVLTSDEILQRNMLPEQQQRSVKAFFKSSFEICLKLF